jgi:hypothetical protein
VEGSDERIRKLMTGFQRKHEMVGGRRVCAQA